MSAYGYKWSLEYWKRRKGDGGGCSPVRTRLHREFPVLQGINRENSQISAEPMKIAEITAVNTVTYQYIP